MICRFWRGRTSAENAPRYEALLRTQVIPGIEARSIPGFRFFDLMRRDLPEGGAEFATVMWFDDLDAVRAFVGEDYTLAYVPPAARALLASFDERAAHFEVIERRAQ